MKGILCLILVSSVSKFKDTRFTRLLRLSLLIVMPQMVGHFKNLAAAMARHTLKIFKNLCFSDGTPHFTMFLDPPPPLPKPMPPPPWGRLKVRGLRNARNRFSNCTEALAAASRCLHLREQSMAARLQAPSTNLTCYWHNHRV